jgi:hypothetical protein
MWGIIGGASLHPQAATPESKNKTRRRRPHELRHRRCVTRLTYKLPRTVGPSWNPQRLTGSANADTSAPTSEQSEERVLMTEGNEKAAQTKCIPFKLIFP